LGIIPGTFVYAQVGTGLGSIFDSGQAFTLGSVLTPEIIIALVGLAVLSVIPVIYKRFRKAA
jgi:phosphoglycerol transferase MdoB-like AlkP superfamily enzyme